MREMWEIYLMWMKALVIAFAGIVTFSAAIAALWFGGECLLRMLGVLA